MKTVIVLALVSVFLGTGCSGDSNEVTRNERSSEPAAREEERAVESRDEPGTEPENLGQAMEQLGKALGELGENIGGDAAVTPVDFRDLRELIPDGVRGMDQTANSGERTGALGIRISKVERTFASDDGEQEVALTLIDLGSLKNAAMMGLGWLQLDVEREDANGFERTFEYKGYPAHETCDTAGAYTTCSLHVVVAERFVLQLEGRGVDSDRLQAIADDVDFKQLDKMKYDGVKAVE